VPRAIWTGSISFGLVNIPVKLYPAVRPHDVRFHQLVERTGNRIRNKRVDVRTGREVAYEDTVKGFELSEDKYVTVSDAELESLQPAATKTVDIEDFVELADIDPVYYDRTYYATPQDNEGARKAYALLLLAMVDQGQVGVGRVVLRQRQHLAAIRPMGRVLALSTMQFADEVVDAGELPGVPARLPRLSPKQKEMAAALIDSLTTDWKPAKYKDTYEDELKRLLRKKERGEEIVVAESPPDRGEVVDLMAALEASVAAGKKGRRRSTRGRRRSPAA
jgi:DNA end-binding protein Ku